MSEATLQQRLVYEGIRAINDCVTKLPMAEAHEAICQLREHLEARAQQTRPQITDFADLLGVQQ